MSLLFVYTILEQFKYGQEVNVKLLILFLAICCSDLLDGRIARKTNSVSTIGAKLDVFADLVYIIISYITLIYVKVLPIWFFVFICFKFTEFIMTSKFMKHYNKSHEKPFIFDKIGRVVSATFLIIPGIVCIYKCFEPYNMELFINCMIFIIFLAGIYSSYLRIKSCFMFANFKNRNYID